MIKNIIDDAITSTNVVVKHPHAKNYINFIYVYEFTKELKNTLSKEDIIYFIEHKSKQKVDDLKNDKEFMDFISNDFTLEDLKIKYEEEIDWCYVKLPYIIPTILLDTFNQIKKLLIP